MRDVNLPLDRREMNTSRKVLTHLQMRRVVSPPLEGFPHGGKALMHRTDSRLAVTTDCFGQSLPPLTNISIGSDNREDTKALHALITARPACLVLESRAAVTFKPRHQPVIDATM